jgi:hypothetical protein
MGYGEKFQGMTPEMVMVEVATRLGNIETKVDVIETKVDQIKCPSPRCIDHEQRITEQERVEKERKEKMISRRELVLWAVGIVVMTIASNFALILSFKGG